MARGTAAGGDLDAELQQLFRQRGLATSGWEMMANVRRRLVCDFSGFGHNR
jgi:hypothetical protein